MDKNTRNCQHGSGRAKQETKVVLGIVAKFVEISPEINYPIFETLVKLKPWVWPVVLYLFTIKNDQLQTNRNSRGQLSGFAKTSETVTAGSVIGDLGDSLVRYF